MVWNSQSHSWVFSWRRASFSSDEFRPRRSAAVFGFDGRFHFSSMVVDALATAAGLLGLLSDGAVGSCRNARRHWRSNQSRVWCAWGWVLCVLVWLTTPHLRSIPSNIKGLLVESCQVST